MDSFTQERVLELREEIAALRRQNEAFRKQQHRTVSQVNDHELRKRRLLEIKEELLSLGGRSMRIQSFMG